MGNLTLRAGFVCVTLVLTFGIAAYGQLDNSAATPPLDTEKPPISIGILVDKSVVRWGGPSLVKGAVSTVLHSLRDEDEYALFTAGERFEVEQEFTTDDELAAAALDHLNPVDKTAVYDAAVAALHYMSSAVTNDRKALLLITSGDDAGSQTGVNEAVGASRQANAPVFIIAVPAGSWRSRADLSPLAAQTGGTLLMPGKKSELAEVSEAVGRRLMGPPLTADASRKPLAGYSELIVRSIPVARTQQTEEFRPGDNLWLQKVLVSRLQDKKVFPQVTDATAQSSGEDIGDGVAAAAPHTKLELLATIVGFKRGSHLKRGTAGILGSGVARVKVQFILRDAATRKPVLSFVKDGAGASGLLAGSDENNEIQAMLRVVKAAVEQVQRNR
jgi:hypothetical protein